MSLFHQVILKGKTQQFIKTIKYKTFAIGAYMVKSGNLRILKLFLAMKRDGNGSKANGHLHLFTKLQ